MAKSKRYRDLERGVRRLRKALLPGKFDPTGSYRAAERVHLRTISFRILVHAEIESFIEERAHDLFEQAWKAWSNDRVPSRVLMGILAFSGHSMPTPPSRIGAPGKKDFDDVDGVLGRAKKHWKEEVYKKNHGIKEANVLALLLPLGIDGNDLDPTLLTDLTSFGGSRGAVAHRSTVGVTNYADPKSEYDQSQLLIKGLESIDTLIGDAIDVLRKTHKSLARK